MFVQDVSRLTKAVKNDGNQWARENSFKKFMIIKGEDYSIELHGKKYHCAMDVTMNFIGGKWKTVVLWYLRNDTKRFSELKALIPQITEKMLSLQLKALEKDGLIERKIYPQVPPKVEYYMSDSGKTLLPLLEELAKWGRNKGLNDGALIKNN